MLEDMAVSRSHVLANSLVAAGSQSSWLFIRQTASSPTFFLRIIIIELSLLNYP